MFLCQAVAGETSGISSFLEVLVITPQPNILFRPKSPWFHLADGASPAGRETCQRRNHIRLGLPGNLLKSQLSHIFENDNK